MLRHKGSYVLSVTLRYKSIHVHLCCCLIMSNIICDFSLQGPPGGVGGRGRGKSDSLSLHNDFLFVSVVLIFLLLKPLFLF